jgi:hypothetical protein
VPAEAQAVRVIASMKGNHHRPAQLLEARVSSADVARPRGSQPKMIMVWTIEATRPLI